MSKQREKPGMPNHVELAAMLGKDPARVKCSGGRFENFRRGWAKYANPAKAPSDKTHFFTRLGFDQATSLCGVYAEVRWLFGPGNFVSCSRCKRAMKVRRISPT